jgi:hypothetical protein
VTAPAGEMAEPSGSEDGPSSARGTRARALAAPHGCGWGARRAMRLGGSWAERSDEPGPGRLRATGNWAERSGRRHDSGGPGRGARIARAGPGPTRTLGPIRVGPPMRGSRPSRGRAAARRMSDCDSDSDTGTRANKRFRFAGRHRGLRALASRRIACCWRCRCSSLPPRRAGHHRKAWSLIMHTEPFVAVLGPSHSALRSEAAGRHRYSESRGTVAGRLLRAHRSRAADKDSEYRASPADTRSAVARLVSRTRAHAERRWWSWSPGFAGACRRGARGTAERHGA